MARLRQAANAFDALGVVPGQVVSLLRPLLPQTFVALYGAQAAGIASPVNPWLSPAQLAQILQAAGTRVLVVGGAAHAATAVDDFDTALDAQPSNRLVSERVIAASAIAGYCHTGGTTGTPKLVRHSQANQVYQAWGLRMMGIAEPGRAILFGLPPFHVGGSLTQGLSLLSDGGCLVVLTAAGWRDARALKHVWRLVQRWRPAVFGGVPTILSAAPQVPRGGLDLPSLSLASGGGAAIAVALIQACEAMGLPVLAVYGMTEIASAHCMGCPHMPPMPPMPRTPRTVGRPLPCAPVKVLKVDAHGRLLGACAADEIGVVAMAGPGGFDGYTSEQHNRGAFVEPGWVNSGGHNIDPAPIEELLYQHPALGLAAMVGQLDADAGELPVAHVQCQPGHGVGQTELIAWRRERSPERRGHRGHHPPASGPAGLAPSGAARLSDSAAAARQACGRPAACWPGPGFVHY